jgi:hypothetical protein
LSRGKTDEKPGKDSAPVNKRTSIASKSTSPQSPGAGSKKNNSNPDDSSTASDTQSTTPQVLTTQVLAPTETKPVGNVDMSMSFQPASNNQQDIKLEQQLDKSIIIDNPDQIVQNKYSEIKQLIEKLTYDTDLTEQENTDLDNKLKELNDLESVSVEDKKKKKIESLKKDAEKEVNEFLNKFVKTDVFDSVLEQTKTFKTLSNELNKFYLLKKSHRNQLYNILPDIVDLEKNYNELTEDFENLSTDNFYSYKTKILDPLAKIKDGFNKNILTLIKEGSQDPMIIDMRQKIIKIMEQEEILKGKDLEFFINENDINKIREDIKNLTKTQEINPLVLYQQITKLVKIRVKEKINNYQSNDLNKGEVEDLFKIFGFDQKGSKIELNNLNLIIDHYYLMCYPDDASKRNESKNRLLQKLIQGSFYTGPNNVNYFKKIQDKPFRIKDDLYYLIILYDCLNYGDNDESLHIINKINRNNNFIVSNIEDNFITIYESGATRFSSNIIIKFSPKNYKLAVIMNNNTSNIQIIKKGEMYKTDLSEEDINILNDIRANDKQQYQNPLITYIKNNDTYDMNSLKKAILQGLFYKNKNLKSNIEEYKNSEKKKLELSKANNKTK